MNSSKVHFNPKFVAPSSQSVPKVHVNPAFINSANKDADNIAQNSYCYKSTDSQVSLSTNSSTATSRNNSAKFYSHSHKLPVSSCYNNNSVYKKVNLSHSATNVFSNPHKTSNVTTSTSSSIFKVDRRTREIQNKSIGNVWNTNSFKSKSHFNTVRNKSSPNICTTTNQYSSDGFTIKQPIVNSRNKLIRVNADKVKSNLTSPIKLRNSLSNINSSALTVNLPFKNTKLSKANEFSKNKYSLHTKTKVIRRKSFERCNTSPSNQQRACIKKYPCMFNLQTYSPVKRKSNVISRTKLINQSFQVKKMQSLIKNKNSNTQLIAKGVKSKYKLHKMKTSKNMKQLKEVARHSHRYINIGGSLYKSTKTSLKRQNSKSPNSQKVLAGIKYSSNKINKRSDKFINIGGIMYKSTKLSLKKQVAKPKSVLEKFSYRSHYYKYALKYTAGNKMSSKYKYMSRSTSFGSQRSLSSYSSCSKKSDNFVNIGGILYKSTKTSLKKQTAKKSVKDSMASKSTKDKQCIIRLRGIQFNISKDGHSLVRSKDNNNVATSFKRIHIGGLTYSCTANGRYELTKHHSARKIVNTAKQRSLAFLSHNKLNHKNVFSKNNKFCLFYNRFGRCTRKDSGKCPYMHDPKKIAICTRFLRGRCKVINCPFSHEIDPAKMPVCSHFLRTACTKDNCPYRHVRVNPNAPICEDFVNGHCVQGEECKKQHILECKEFNTETGCPRGKSCPLSHRKKQQKQNTVGHLQGTKQHKLLKSPTNTWVLGNKKSKKLHKALPKLKPQSTDTDRYFKVSTVSNKVHLSSFDDQSLDTNCSDDLQVKRTRVLAKVNKMVSIIKDEPNYHNTDSTIRNNTASIKSLKFLDSTESRSLKFRPFTGPLPSFIPLNISDNE